MITERTHLRLYSFGSLFPAVVRLESRTALETAVELLYLYVSVAALMCTYSSSSSMPSFLDGNRTNRIENRWMGLLAKLRTSRFFFTIDARIDG